MRRRPTQRRKVAGFTKAGWARRFGPVKIIGGQVIVSADLGIIAYTPLKPAR